MASNIPHDPTTIAKALPRHVAIVMDGNGRWANRRMVPRSFGHREGVKAVRRIVGACRERDIEVLTLFAFSSENWRRPQMEVSLLMDLFLTTLRSEVRRLHENDVRLRFIGDRSAFSRKLQRSMEQAEAQTHANCGLVLVVAVNYGGRWDITQAARRVAHEAMEGKLDPESITAESLQRYICLNDMPAPDLLIRTGGEQRISNFLLWQLAYAELYFTNCLWPDFDAEALDDALASFAKRQRRFGQTGNQVEQRSGA